MDLRRFQKINDYQWALPFPNSNKIAARFYGDENIIQHMEDKVGEQILNVARLPGLVKEALVMPDGHWGYGFPIGGVAAFDENEGVISAGGVGFDISCGIRFLRTPLRWQEVEHQRFQLAEILFETIPAGVGASGKLRFSIRELDEILSKGAVWAVEQGFGFSEELEFVEEEGHMMGALSECVSEQAKKRQLNEMGTLGSGNHYLEVQVVDTIFDEAAAQAFGLFKGQVVISIHCGSRGLGHQIGTDYLVKLAKFSQHLGKDLPDRELGYAPLHSEVAKQYLGAMRAGINCALANRQILSHFTRQAFQKLIPGVAITTVYDVSHNTCKQEEHWVDGERKPLYVHRKGATRAFGPGHPLLPEVYRAVGQPVIIGGSMGTASYVLVGNALIDNSAFASASHGAGRAMSRRQAAKQWRGADLVDTLAKAGIIIRSRTLRGVSEEAPGAYKQVEGVAWSTEQAGLARRAVLMKPKICIKG